MGDFKWALGGWSGRGVMVGLTGLLALSGCTSVTPETSEADENGPGFELADDEEETGSEVWYDFDPLAAAGDEPLLNPKSGGFPPCGQPMVDARSGSQLGYQGVLVYSNGACSGGRDGATSCARTYSTQRACQQNQPPLGPQPDAVAAFDPTRSSSTNRWQCVEFAKRVFARLYRVYGWDGDAHQMLDLAPRDVEVRRQGDQRAPVAGDAVVYGNGGYGHVAIVTRVQGDKVFLVGQNEGASFERQASYRNGQLTDPGFPSLTVLGWAHATANGNGGGAAAPSAPAPAQAEECNLQFWNCTSDRSARFHCANGRVSEYETCAYECQSQASGRDDLCVDRNGNTGAGAPSSGSGSGSSGSGSSGGAPAAAPECRDRDARYWTCAADGSAMARCSNERWEVTQCANGCRSQWWDDECAAAPANNPAPPANNGGSSGGSSGNVNGVPQGECNYRYWNCTADGGGRFRCAGGRVVDSERCDQGCVVQSSGTDDVCQAAIPRATPVCTDSCPYAGDGECDDGGPGSAYNVCEQGTDCSDCGRRD
jgi:hypothetical protein